MVRFDGDTDRADQVYDGMTPLTADDVADTLTWVRTSVPAAQLSSVHLDLTSLASVTAAAAAIQDLTPAVHVLSRGSGRRYRTSVSASPSPSRASRASGSTRIC